MLFTQGKIFAVAPKGHQLVPWSVWPEGPYSSLCFLRYECKTLPSYSNTSRAFYLMTSFLTLNKIVLLILNILKRAEWQFKINKNIDQLPRWSSGKEFACHTGDARDTGLIPGLGRFPGISMATHSSSLPWKIPWTEEPDRLLSPWAKTDTAEQMHTLFILHYTTIFSVVTV